MVLITFQTSFRSDTTKDNRSEAKENTRATRSEAIVDTEQCVLDKKISSQCQLLLIVQCCDLHYHASNESSVTHYYIEG